MTPSHRLSVPVAMAALILLMRSATADNATTARTFAVGDARIDVVTTVFPATTEPLKVAFVSVHDDEETAVEAAGDVLRDLGGRLVELRHTGEREVAFRLGSTEHRIDPNRIFTPAGRRATLAALSTWSQPADDVVAAFTDELLSTLAIDDVDVIVASTTTRPIATRRPTTLPAARSRPTPPRSTSDGAATPTTSSSSPTQGSSTPSPLAAIPSSFRTRPP